MKAIKRAYSTPSGGVDMESIQELFYGSLEEREALATAITAQGVDTNVSDTLGKMAENVDTIMTGATVIKIGSNLSDVAGGGSGTINVSHIKGYEKFTVDNFFTKIIRVYACASDVTSTTCSYSYNPESGAYTYNVGFHYGVGRCYAQCEHYLIY